MVYMSRRGRKPIFAFVLVALLCLILATLSRKLVSSPFSRKIYSPSYEDPLELLLTEDDVTRAGSEAAYNATLGVSCCRFSLQRQAHGVYRSLRRS
jgi:hypothetical protein